MVRPVYVISSVRTATGNRGGGISRIEPVELGAVAIGECAKRGKVSSEKIGNVKLGCATQTAEQGYDMARTAVLKALGHKVPASTVNMLCGSGAEAINDIWGQIASGQIDIGIAGGAENNFMVFQGQDLMPFSTTLSGSLGNIWKGFRLGPKIARESLPDWYMLHPMGKSGDAIAKEWKMDRKDLDRFAAESQWKAAKAMYDGKFDEEIVPVETPYGTIKRDEGIRPDTRLDALANLPARFGKTIPKWGIPVFPFTKLGVKTGYHTAGNSSQISAGAAALMLASEEAVIANHLDPIAKIIATARVGTDPMNPGQQLIGPPEAVRAVLEKAGRKLSDIDEIELNEAFAAVALATIRALQYKGRVNPNGGAIAIGHPLGASGARLPVTLLHEMQREKYNLGLSTLCIGGGQAIATLFERVDAAEFHKSHQ